MAYIVGENCLDCMFTTCVEVCPVDCFWGNDKVDKTIYIDPETCIHCAACEPECPVGAIYAEEDVPPEQKKWVEINRQKTAGNRVGLVNITKKKPPLPTAEAKKKRLGR